MTRGAAQGHMATTWDLIAAVKANADLPRASSADFVGEIEEDAEAVAVDAWADKMIARGVERRLAMQCAADIWEGERAKDAEACGVKGGGVAALASDQSLESVRKMMIRIVQAPKPRMSAGCLLLAIGAEFDGVSSSREWAQRQAVSHELTANEVEGWQRRLKLPKALAQKSERAKSSYRITNGRRTKKA